MKLSTPSAPKPREPLSILLLGPPGSRKTTLAMQFPRPYFIDCDGNLDGPERYLRANGFPQLEYGYDSVNFTDDGKEVAVEKKYDRLEQLLRSARTADCQTVIVDSMTMVNEFIIRKVLDEQKQPAMRPIDWQPLKSFYWKLLVSGIRGMGKTTIVTCHEIILTEPDPKAVMKENIVGYKPSVQGGIADYFGAFFTDIFRCVIETEATTKGPVTKSKLYTCKTTKSPDLKNSLGLPAVIDASYAEIKKYIP